jgi:hypothetical protein
MNHFPNIHGSLLEKSSTPSTSDITDVDHNLEKTYTADPSLSTFTN